MSMAEGRLDLRNLTLSRVRLLRHVPYPSLRRPTGWFVLAVQLAALVAVAVGVHGTSRHCVAVLAVLAVLGVAYAEACGRNERLRRFLGGDVLRADCLSVWTFAAVLVLPPGYAALLVLVVYGHATLATHRHQAAPLLQQTFTGCATAVAAFVGGTVFRLVTSGLAGPGASLASPAGTVGAAAALLVYTFTSLGLVITVMWLAAGRPAVTSLVPGRDQVVFEQTTLVLGALTGVLLDRAIWFVPAVLLLLMQIHRSALVSQLQHAAHVDGKTGLLNAPTWRERTSSLLGAGRRDGTPTALLVVDLDHFKAVNDTHGHLVGDQVLVAVADCLRSTVRGRDLVGRFGGEEFVVTLADATLEAASRTADRIRDVVRRLDVGGVGITASIGITCCEPGVAADLDTMLAAADSALYEAKRAGRDATRVTV